MNYSVDIVGFGRIWRKFVMFIPLIILLLSCNKGNSFTVNGTVSNLKNQEVLISYIHSDNIVLDTVRAKANGKFSYKNDIDTLTSFSFYFNDHAASVVVFANPKDAITIKGDASVPDLIKVSGNTVNDELTDFKEQNKELLAYRAVLLENYINSHLERNSSAQDKILSENDDLIKINAVNRELVLNAEAYIEKYPARFSSLILVNEFFANPENQKSFERMMEMLQGDILKTKMALDLKNYLNKISRSAEGTSMPYFQLIDMKGDTLTSYDFKGKHLLLSFVSATGVDSHENIETLKEIYENVNRDSVEFISVYIDANIPSSLKHIENDSLRWSAVAEKNSWAADVVDAYSIEFVPNNILISPEGIISDRNISAMALKDKLSKTSINMY